MKTLNQISTLLSVFLFLSCTEQTEDKQIESVIEPSTPDLSHDLVFGKWELDYSTNTSEKPHYVYISNDSSYFRFSRWNGGGMVDSGLLFSEDSIKGKHFWKYKYGLLDSFSLYIIDGNGFNNDTNYYYKSTYFDYRELLNISLKSDSLRNQILGWWKLENRKYPVDLVNYSKNCHQFTLNIRDDGKAIFYLENQLDSTVEYHYQVGQDYIDFNRGCVVGSNSYISVSDNKMKLQLNKYDFDTLELRRVTKI